MDATAPPPYAPVSSHRDSSGGLIVVGATAIGMGVLLADFSRDGRDRSWLGVGVGILPRTGVPWMIAAFVVGCVAGWSLRSLSLRAAVAVGAMAAMAALTIANARYYRVDRWSALLESGTPPRFWTVAGVVVGATFGAAGAVATRHRATFAGGLAVVALAVTIAAEPFLWARLGDNARALSPTGAWASLAIGAALPAALLSGRQRLFGLIVVPAVVLVSLATPAVAAAANHFFSIHT